MTTGHRSVTAFAPASVGNVAVGFDVLGHALEATGDRVRLEGRTDPEIRLQGVSGLISQLPEAPDQNTALRSLAAIRKDFQIRSGVSVFIEKGIALSSGMGGSAASAVAAVTAAAEFWGLELSVSQRLHYALQGEAVASGAVHADNVAPCLLGGLVFCENGDSPRAVRIPVPEGIVCVLVHPHLEIRTREARGLLSATVPMAAHVRQTTAIGGFIAGCYRGDVAMIGRCLRDFVVEPQRQRLVPGFREVQTAAMEAGALGASLSGSGPSLFAWCRAGDADGVRRAMEGSFADLQIDSEAWVSPLDTPGARIEPRL